jgi:hypothetical protein
MRCGTAEVPSGSRRWRYAPAHHTSRRPDRVLDGDRTRLRRTRLRRTRPPRAQLLAAHLAAIGVILAFWLVLGGAATLALMLALGRDGAGSLTGYLVVNGPFCRFSPNLPWAKCR